MGGLPGRVFIEVQMHVSLVMVATVYNLLGGLNLIDIVGSSVEWLTPEVSIALVALAMWFHVFLKSLGEVAAVSAINTVIALGLAVVIVVQAVLHPPASPPQTTFIVTDPLSLGGGFATFIYAIYGEAVQSPIYNTPALAA